MIIVCQLLNKLLGYTFLLSFFLGSVVLLSSPRVIRDNRVNDIGLSPVLGRGYSPAVNTFQNVCFRNLNYLKPSFDFNYTFESLSSLKETSSKSIDLQSPEVLKFINKHTSKKETFIRNVKYYYHYLLSILSVTSYYSSIDGAKTQLNEPALKILNRGDLLGFFSSCGSSYVRAISRKSQHITIFSYTTYTKEKDISFEESLKQTVQNFDMDDKKTSKYEQRKLDRFAYSAHRKNLQVVARSLGLVGSKENLIALDMNTYKKVIVAAFRSTQDERVGRILSIEMEPWIDNTLFQSLLNLKEVYRDGRKILPFEQRIILNQNADFYTKINHTALRLKDRAQKALLCRRFIDKNFKKGGRIIPKYDNRRVLNQRTGRTASVKGLERALSAKTIKKVIQAERNFVHGTSPDFNDGSNYCLSSMIDLGLTKTPHHQIASCKKLEKKLIIFPSAFIDDYCLPVLVDSEGEGEEK